MKQWRLIFVWPSLTLVQIDGSDSVLVPDVGNGMLTLLSHLSDGDIISYEVDNGS